jgi:hypothetical protein
MAAYRCYYLSFDDHIVSVETLIAADDQTAMETVKGLFAAREDAGHSGYEVWKASRLVGRARRSPS